MKQIGLFEGMAEETVERIEIENRVNTVDIVNENIVTGTIGAPYWTPSPPYNSGSTTTPPFITVSPYTYTLPNNTNIATNYDYHCSTIYYGEVEYRGFSFRNDTNTVLILLALAETQKEKYEIIKAFKVKLLDTKERDFVEETMFQF